MLGYLITSSLFLGSGIAAAVSRQLVNFLQPIFFKNPNEIPSFSPDVVHAKTYDLTEFGLSVIFTLLVFGVNFLFHRLWNKRNTNGNVRLLNILFLTFSFVVFLQTHFITFSGKSVILLVLAGQLLYFTLCRLLREERLVKTDLPLVSNGILTGFFLLLFGNALTTTVAIPLMFLAASPVFYILFAGRFGRFFRSPAHLLLLVALFFPTNLLNLSLLGILIFIIVIPVADKPLHNKKISDLLIQFIYPAAIIVLLAYNPSFYLGNFDSVEEGFWLGWLQRLINHQVLYRDVAIYHPPFIVWGMYLFTKILGFSVYNTRLFLHLLQIMGFVLFYFVVDRLLFLKGNKIVAMVLAFGFTSTLVRNNIEIRVAIGLLPLVIWHNYFNRSQPKWLILAGVFSAIALFISLEVGVVAIVTLLLVTLLFTPNRIKNGGLTVLGILIGSLPILLFLWSQGALMGFISQLSFYARGFARGYFNSEIERAVSLSFLYWHIIDQYFSSIAWMWELARMGLLSGLMVVVAKVFSRRLDNRGKLAAALVIFGLLLFRSVLGRSDWYHLLFVLLIAAPLLLYVIEQLSGKKHYLNLIAAVVFLFVFGREWVSGGFIDKQLYKLETYGRVVGSYHSYNFERARILVGEEINTSQTDELVEYVHQEMSETDTLFAYPWMPELYFLANRKNATSYDTPYAFFGSEFQKQMIREIEEEKPSLVVYNPEMKFANLTPDSLPLVNKYILENFTIITNIGENKILKRN